MVKATGRRKKAFIPLLILIVVLVAAFMFAQSQTAKKIYYGYRARTAFASEVKKFRNPLNTLGFAGISSRPAHCSSEQIYGVPKPRLQCVSGYQKYVVIGQDSATQNLFNAKAAQLDNMLKQDGWTVQSNAAPTLTAWFQGITSGKDYFPDIGGYKNTGKAHCDFDINVAYSNPKPPAYSINMECSSPVIKSIETLL